MKTETKTYILELKNGNTRRVEVPANWKLTFGPTVPYAGKYTGTSEGTALRFYEGNKENLRAIFTDVKSFRDSSIPVMERKTETTRQVVQRQDAGGAKNVIVEARVTEWVNPDDDEPQAAAAAPFLAALAEMNPEID